MSENDRPAPVRRPLDAAARAEGDAPMAMQIALRVEKNTPPSDLDACEAAAAACVALLDLAQRMADGDVEPAPDEAAPDEAAPDEAASSPDAASPDPSWLDAVDAWRGTAIRKIVRRCRGKRWDDAQALPGVSVRVGDAEARAFVPAPAWPLPPELAKMQVEGTELPARNAAHAEGREPHDETRTPGGERAFVTVRLTPLATMTSGKSAAQCAHAAQRAWESMNADERRRWAADGFRVDVVRDDEAHWASTPGRVSIVDAGFTELDGEHETTRANW